MKLRLSIAQTNIDACEPEKNIKRTERFISLAAKKKSDMICFPELWTTGLNWEYNKRHALEHQAVLKNVAGLARAYRIWVAGSAIYFTRNRRASNAALLFDSSGKIKAVYAKTHLFGLLDEDAHMEKGDSLVAVKTPWGKVGFAVCYDIRFPEIFRAYALNGVKLVFCPAAFAYPRLHHWKTLVRARAIEDQMFMAAVNRVGQEDFGKHGKLDYFGASMIVDPWGDIIAEGKEKKEMLITADIDLDKADVIRAKMPVLKDRRPDVYKKISKK